MTARSRKVNCNMRSLLCAAALLLPLALCSGSESSSSEELVQVQLPGSKTASPRSLNPIDLRIRKDTPRTLFNYGYIIDLNESDSSEIIVEKQTLKIPKNAKALLVTLPKREGKQYRQDIQISSYLGLELPEFKKMTLRDHHLPIYLQLAKTPAKASHGQKKRTPRRSDKSDKEKTPRQGDRSDKEKTPRRGEKEESRSPRHKAFKTSQQKFEDAAKASVRGLFSKVGQKKWPSVVIGYVSATNAKDGRAQAIQPSTQTANKYLAAEFFSFPYNQGDVLAYIKIQNKLINLTDKLEETKKNKNPHIIIEMDIVRKRSDGSLIFPSDGKVKVSPASSDDVRGITGIAGNSCNIYFQFNKNSSSEEEDSSSESSDEDEDEEEPPKYRKAKSRLQRHPEKSSESNSQ